MLNVASPSLAFRFSHIPNKGVGLAREEFIINNYIGIHPLALLAHRALNDKELSAIIRNKIVGFKDEEDFFVSKLSFGVAKIAAAFYPYKVIVRFSDFKSNEYYNLLGGNHFEPKEENPMIGFRGAFRYYHDLYKDGFALECRAIKYVREEMGLTNIKLMIPFCRTIGEAEKVVSALEENGLDRSQDPSLEIYMMAEIPSNVLLAEKFAELFDGFSIGSNDLTQLTLGIDRDSSLVSSLFTEQDEAAKMMIGMVIEKAKKAGVKIGLCGQAPSDDPAFAQFLVQKGIDSISFNADAIIKGIQNIKLAEQKMKPKEEEEILNF